MNGPDLSDSEMAELRDAFITQANEILTELPRWILALEENPGEESWKALRRGFHTLKGDSRAMGFHALSTYAHKVEDLIAGLREDEPGKDSVDLLLECVDEFEVFLAKTVAGEEPDVSGIVGRIDARLGASPKGTAAGLAICRGHPAGAVPGAPAVVKDGACASAGGGPVAADRKRRGRERSFLRIESDRVDRIINLVGELVIGRSMLNQISFDIDELQKETIAQRLYSLNCSFERTLSELQRSVMKVRMLPVGHVFRPFPRMVRDLAAEKGKEVKFVIQGEDTELDKGIVDVIGEPLLHLIRNAVDHGIERPGEREASGKQPEGLLTVRAFHQGNQIVIEVEDDGAGIDIDAVREKAVVRNLISADDARKMGAKEAMNLVFSSGLSTKAEITEVSGRGVGMDIVKEVVESLRGIIDVTSERCAGTKFTLRLPLTLAIIKAILFDSGGETCAIPLSSVTEIIRAFPEDLETVGGRPVLRHRKGILPIIAMNGRGLHDGKSFIMLIGIGHLRAGLIVDRIVGEEELVIKALDERAAGRSASGASILGNGRVVLILDPLSLIRKASVKRDPAPAAERTI